MQKQTADRVYGGRSADDRRAQRRERWLAAGLELFGTLGLRGTSLRALARESGVAERYFAENFDSLEHLLAAVHDRAHEQIRARMLAAVAGFPSGSAGWIRAGLEEMLDAMEEDPRVARVKLIESLGGGPVVETSRQASLRELAGYLAAIPEPDLPGSPAGSSPRIRGDVLALAVVGGMFEVLAARHAGRLELRREELIDHCLLLLRTPRA